MISLRKFQGVSADARGGGTRDEALRVSAWEAIPWPVGLVRPNRVRECGGYNNEQCDDPWVTNWARER